VLVAGEQVTSEGSIRVLTDDGRAVEAAIQTTEADLADAREVLRQVRYWELPLAYARVWEAAVPDADQLV
jgi:hypothetical protein